MSNMRLTTLNLDDECTEILRKEQNKSRYVRAAIKRYPEVVKNLDEMEDLYTRYLSAFRHLASAVADNLDTTFNVDFLADYMDETPLAITQMADAGYLKDALVAASLRHGSL